MAGSNYIIHGINAGTFAIEERTRLMQGLCYLLCGAESALMIDTGTGREDISAVVRGLTDLPVIVANTHAHLDHIGGNHYFSESWYHKADQEIFRLHSDPQYTLGLFAGSMPRPLRAMAGFIAKGIINVDTSGSYHCFGDGHVFRLGGRDVEVLPTPGHTPGSVCFLDRESRQLFSGDTVCERGVLLHFAGESCPPAVFLSSIQRLKSVADAYDAIWPGHHGFPVDKDYVDDYLACARQIVDGTARYKKDRGRRCACYGRIIITLPAEAKEAAARG